MPAAISAVTGAPAGPHEGPPASVQLLGSGSAAWPPGRYETEASGRIRCDGTYIGQSVRPLMATVRHWQELLPRNHRVSAMIVVHGAAEGVIALPAATPGSLAWVLADNAAHDLRQRIWHGHQSVSKNAVAALIAATACPQ